MKTILIQLDTDEVPCTFDRVVAVDAGIEEIFSYGNRTPENIIPLVHGSIFTRGGDDLKSTAIFIGGSNVQAGEELMKAVEETFFGPVRVSVMMDSNGSNTTATAAILAASKHLELSEIDALVLGGTGPVGHRAVQLLAAQGARVRVGSRSLSRAKSVCDAVAEIVPEARLIPLQTSTFEDTSQAIEGSQLLLSAGAHGVQLVTREQWEIEQGLQVIIDLNAVPPLGIEGVKVTDKGQERSDVICYGALGVGGTKMKIHKAALRHLFTSNDLLLDTEAIFNIARELK